MIAVFTIQNPYAVAVLAFVLPAMTLAVALLAARRPVKRGDVDA